MTTLFMRNGLFGRRKFRQGVGSVKIKLLLSCCIIFTLLALASWVSSFLGWKQYHTAYVGRSFLPRKGYTLLINTWKRNDLLRQSISHYSSCPGLDSIHIVWSEPDPPADSLIKFLNHTVQSNSKNGRHIELKFDINKEDSLNNRFKEIKDLKTDALFSIDDDVIFPCQSVELAFSVWQSSPDIMVGFVPRAHWVDKSASSLKISAKITVAFGQLLYFHSLYPISLIGFVFTLPEKGEADKYIYGGWWSVWWTGTYSMVLSKAAFFHEKYLRMYTYQMPASIREYTTKNRNCEDIAMSFLVAHATGAPPVWVQSKIYESGSTGISSLGGHNEKRTECVNKFVAEYGHMPLVSTSAKAVDSRSSWFW